MKPLISLFFCLCLGFKSFGELNPDLEQVFNSHDFSNVKTVSELSSTLKTISKNQRQYLELLLLWANKYMQVDSTRFFAGGAPLAADKSILLKTGLCDEFSNIVTDYCKAAGINTIRIEGYVKEISSSGTQKFEQTNHAWNAVLIDSTWLMCDLFWSVSELKYNEGSAHFVKRLNDNYFLSKPETFAHNHLPVIPLLQFTAEPITIAAFSTEDFSGKPYMSMPAFTDSLKFFLRFSEEKRQLYIAPRSYQFNPNNPNTLIAVYYNKAVEIAGNTKSSVAELRSAKAYLNTIVPLIPTSTVADIRALALPVQKTQDYIDKVLKIRKG